MDDLLGRLWDRPYYYNQNPNPNPYAGSYAPEYYYQPQPVTQSVPKFKPRSFSVPVSDNHNPPSRAPDRPNGGYSSSSRPKNVVSIPVNFVNSDAPKAPSNDEKKSVGVRPRMDESAAAVKVQKVFRGFSVRKSAPLKNLKIIAKAKAEGEKIRKRVSYEKVVDLVRRDEKERIRITESIMSLLLKLDAIQGVNFLVRESRKAATRELVSLQDTLDAIIADKPMEEEMHKEYAVCSHTEDKSDILDKNEETAALESLHVNSGEEIKDQDGLDHPKEVDYVDGAELRDSKPSETQAEESLPTQMHDLQLESSHETTESCTSQCIDDNVELEKVRCDVSGSDNGFIAEMLETETVRNDENMKAKDYNMEYEEVVDATGMGDTLSMRKEATEDIGMVKEENKRLKTVVDDLLKKSEKQNQMIDNLSSRIAQLEEQVSKKKKIAEQRKKTRAVTGVASRRNASKEDWF